MQQDYDDDLLDWEDEKERQIQYEHEAPRQAGTGTGGATDPQVAQDSTLEQKLAEFWARPREAKMAAMLSEWHSSCVPAPYSVADFLASDKPLTDRGRLSCPRRPRAR